MAGPNTNRPFAPGRTPDALISASPAPSSLATDASPSDPGVLRTLYSVLLKTRMLE